MRLATKAGSSSSISVMASVPSQGGDEGVRVRVEQRQVVGDLRRASHGGVEHDHARAGLLGDELGRLLVEVGLDQMALILFCWMRLMISRVCVGEGGMPGLGLDVPTISSLNALAKLGQESWKVMTLARA
jgi:hypothetical protein